MEFRVLKYFLTVVREENITKSILSKSLNSNANSL